MNDKLQAEHLERAAYVYVRQSTAQQVRTHRESQQRQYALVDRARQLGFARVVVIDEDLGKSGSGLVDRPGFGQLLAAICGGEAGAVLALEASRLARNNRDWHHLLDLCAMTNTVIIDDNGVYDPKQINDRLLLGLQGTMSEFELSLFRQRARQAFEQKVQRGHAMWEVLRISDSAICWHILVNQSAATFGRSVFQSFQEASGRNHGYWTVDPLKLRRDGQHVAGLP